MCCVGKESMKSQVAVNMTLCGDVVYMQSWLY
jgi:hypothetical protein